MGVVTSQVCGKGGKPPYNPALASPPRIEPERGAVHGKMPSSSSSDPQLQVMTAHLNAVPSGSHSQGLVKKIRLIRKSALLKNPTVAQVVSEVTSILPHITQKELSRGYGGSDQRSCADTFIDEVGQAKISNFTNPSSVAATRAKLEDLLFWRNSNADSLCELFDLNACPPFTFISHRWAYDPVDKKSRALGLHNELILILASSDQDYIWLDCCCAPQDPFSFESGNCLKVIWNIGELLDRSTDMKTYYAIDGLGFTADSDVNWGEEVHFQKLSHGILTLFVSHSSNQGHLARELNARDAVGSARLWCLFERRVKKIAFMTERSEGWCDRRTNTVAAYEDNLSCHDANQSSLSCFDAADILPVSTIMFNRGEFPALFREGLLVLPKDERKGGGEEGDFMYGVLLPELSDSLDTPDRLHGWYRNDAFRMNAIRADTTYHINLEWPDNPRSPSPLPYLPRQYRLQLHESCLREHCSQKCWTYHPSEAREDLTYFDRPFDRMFGRTFTKTSCLFCYVPEPSDDLE